MIVGISEVGLSSCPALTKGIMLIATSGGTPFLIKDR